MLDWITKELHPPGITRKNRGSLFSVIGRVFGRVKDDADRAFKAHFPYLADEKTLAQHGASLSIPRLEHDTDKDFRERVAAASFYLMRAGERGYNKEQLATHFGADAVQVIEQFLHVSVKLLNSSPEDRQWAYDLLDRVVNPNVKLSLIDWQVFEDMVASADSQGLTLRRTDRDRYPTGGGLRCDGSWLCDQGRLVRCDGSWVCDGTTTCQGVIPALGTILNTAKVENRCNGAWRCDGSVNCSGYSLVEAEGAVTLPVLGGGTRLIDELGVTLGFTLSDRARVSLRCDGTWLCDGRNLDPFLDAVLMPIELRPQHEDRAELEDGEQAPFTLGWPGKETYRPLCDGSWLCDQGRTVVCDGSWVCDGTTTCQGTAPLEPVSDAYGEAAAAALTLAPLEDTMRTQTVCDGSWICDGARRCDGIGEAPVEEGPLVMWVTRHVLCNGTRATGPTLRCDGSWTCDGTHTCFEGGWYCDGEILEEVL